MTEAMGGTVSIPSSTVVQRLEGGGILAVNAETGRQYTFDGVGSDMWDALFETPTVREALARLLDRYEVDEATLTTDLANYISRLVQAGLVERE